jgi:hypothetical protein
VIQQNIDDTLFLAITYHDNNDNSNDDSSNTGNDKQSHSDNIGSLTISESCSVS